MTPLGSGSNPESPAMMYIEAKNRAEKLNSGAERLKFGDPSQISVIRFLRYRDALLEALDSSTEEFSVKCPECGGSGIIETCSNKYLDDWDEETCEECGGDGWINPENIICNVNCTHWEMVDIDLECFGGRIAQALDN